MDVKRNCLTILQIASQQTQNIIKNIHISQQIAKDNYEETQAKMKERYDKNSSEVKFKVGDQVLLLEGMKKKGRNPKLAPKYRGPFRLSQQLTPVTFELEDPNNKKIIKSHVNRFKPYVGLE